MNLLLLNESQQVILLHMFIIMRTCDALKITNVRMLCYLNYFTDRKHILYRIPTHTITQITKPN